MKMFDAGKTIMIGLPTVKKNCDDMLRRFHLIPERNGQTDEQTDRRTDGRTDCYINIARRVSMLTHDKNRGNKEQNES